MTTYLLALIGLVAVAGGIWWWLDRRPQKIPDNWPLASRLVLNSKERAMYDIIAQTFPHLLIFVKLPLTRFMQLRETKSVEYWYNLISPLNVTYAMCTREGRVVAAIDLVFTGKASESALVMKTRAMRAAEVKYITLDAQTTPTPAQLRHLILGDAGERPASPSRTSQAPKIEDFEATRARLEQLLSDKRAGQQRDPRDMWYRDSVINKDSFIMPDSRINSGFQSSGLSGIEVDVLIGESTPAERKSAHTPAPASTLRDFRVTVPAAQEK
jgi:hypothetical protein